MKSKTCNFCKIEKELEFFHKDKKSSSGYCTFCKVCKKAKVDAIRSKNKKKYVEAQLLWRENNRDKVASYKKKYDINNRDKINAYKKIYKKDYLKKGTLPYLKEKARGVIKDSFRRKSIPKVGKTRSIIGCDWDTLLNHLLKSAQNNYPDNNITKENLFDFEWHVDHITPLATAKTEEEIVKLNHYSNLQLLTPRDNLVKGDRVA